MLKEFPNKQIHRDLVCAFLGLRILNKSNCCPAFVVVVVASLTINQRKIKCFLLKREGMFFHQSLPPEAQHTTACHTYFKYW